MFFDDLSKLLGYRVDSFQQIIDIVSEFKNTNEKVKTDFIYSKKEKNTESSSFNHSLMSQLSAAKSKINSLQCEIEHANAVIFKQKNAINELKLNNDEYKSLYKDEIRDAHLYQANEIHNEKNIFKLETKIDKLKNAIVNLRKENQYLKEQFDRSSNEFIGEEEDCYNMKHSKTAKNKYMISQNNDIDLLISHNNKLKMKIKCYKQKLAEFQSEIEKLQHHLKLKSECHWSNSSIKDAFHNIQDILGLDPDASPCETYSAVSSLVCRLHSCM